MTTREKIIVGAMFLTVAYGVNALFFSGDSGPDRAPSAGAGPGAGEMSDMVVEQAGRLLAETFSSREIYAMNLSRYGFRRNPFLELETDTLTLDYQEAPADSVFEEFNPVYSGYLIMGNKILAVINGMEYEEGDMLDRPGLFVVDISPSRVVIGAREGEKKIIPIIESE
jgi:hypothetical protein